MIRTATITQSPRKIRSRFALAAAVSVAAVAATGAWLYSAGPVKAPEPARLTSTLYGSGSRTPVLYVYSNLAGYGYFLSSSWTWSTAPAGAPCSTTAPVPAGTVLYGIVYASGNYRRCQ